MGKEKRPRIRADQAMAEEFLGHVVGDADHRAHRLQREALADDGRRLQGPLIQRRQAVRPRQNEALDGGRHRLRTALARIAQELFEEQRISFRPLDAAGDHAVIGDGQPDRQRPRLGPAQRAKIDDRQRAAARLAAPCGVDGIALDARGHRQDHRRFIGNMRQGGEHGEHRRIRPMDVLDQDHDGLLSCEPPEQCLQRGFSSLLTGRGIHGVGYGPQFHGLRHVEKIIEEDQVGLIHQARANGRRDLLCPAIFAGAGHDTQQAARQAADRVLALAGAEIQHQGAMAGEAPLGRHAQQLRRGPRLADASLAPQQHDMAFTGIAASIDETGQLPQFGLAADEGCIELRPGRFAIAGDAPEVNGLIDALHHRGPGSLAFDLPADGVADGIGHQGFAGLRQVAQARGQIHGVADHRVFRAAVGSHSAGHDLPAGDADMQLQRPADLIAQLGDRTVHVGRPRAPRGWDHRYGRSAHRKPP